MFIKNVHKNLSKSQKIKNFLQSFIMFKILNIFAKFKYLQRLWKVSLQRNEKYRSYEASNQESWTIKKPLLIHLIPLKKPSVFEQKLPIWCTHHTFLKSEDLKGITNLQHDCPQTYPKAVIFQE